MLSVRCSKRYTIISRDNAIEDINTKDKHIDAFQTMKQLEGVHVDLYDLIVYKKFLQFHIQ